MHYDNAWSGFVLISKEKSSYDDVLLQYICQVWVIEQTKQMFV